MSFPLFSPDQPLHVSMPTDLGADARERDPERSAHQVGQVGHALALREHGQRHGQRCRAGVHCGLQGWGTSRSAHAARITFAVMSARLFWSAKVR